MAAAAMHRPGVRSIVVMLLAVAACRWRKPPSGGAGTAITDLPRRVTIEVLNSGGNVGAARVGMLLLRRARLDVVSWGNADAAESGRVGNQVLVRRGDTTGVGRVLEALGGAEIIDAPDSTRLVDLTVLLGRNFSKSPAGPRP